MLRGLYSLGWIIAIPVVLVYLLYRSLKQPEYRLHWNERFGGGGLEPPDSGRFAVSRPIWIHAVSVGETAAAAPLVRRLAALHPQASFLLTHTTPTGRAAGRDLFRDLGPRLSQCYLPYDLTFAVSRFLDRRRPLCGLIMETEVWPNLMHAARTRNIPVAAVNARLSGKSLARGLKYRGLIAPAIASFDVIVAQSPADSARIAQLARPAEAIAGNLKFDQSVSEEALQAGADWRRRLSPRRIVVAASTRDGEEALLLDRWRNRRAGPGEGTAAARRAGVGAAPADESGAALLVIVPRHPNRFETVAARIAAASPGRRLLRRADLDGEDLEIGGNDVLLGDSMGEMQRWYACADVVIMGGSLLPFGSQNLIEPNAVGCPVVLGPSVFNFEQAAAESLAAGASVQVAGAAEAIDAALAIAADAPRRSAMSQAALGFAQAHRGATERTLAALEPLLHRVLEVPQETIEVQPLAGQRRG
jgi:3-deoxy-D-manno-octulosonic-acid transferase